MANTGNTQQQINYGAAVNDGEGDPLRTAFIKTDDNFDNVWLAGPVGSNITITNNTVQVNNTNGNLILSPNGTGVIQTNSRLLPRLNNTYDFGSTTLKYRTGYFGVGGLVIDGNVTVAGNLTAGNISYTGNVFVGDLQGSVYADDSTIMVDAVDNELFASRATISGNVSGTYFIGNGSLLTGVVSYGNSNVAAYLPTYTGNLAGGNLNITGNISATGNVAGGNLVTGGRVAAGNIVSSGNVAGSYFIGNGSQLTGIASSYGNSNVAAYLPTYAGTLSGNYLDINSSGNIWIMSNGALNFPTGASWYSDISTNDEFISSNVDGYLNFRTFDSISNLATELHMEHGLVHINVYNGSLKQWEFNEDGTTHLPGDLLPQANLGGNLGNQQYQWNDLWVSNNTIYLNSVPITLSDGNVLAVNGNAVLTNNSNTTVSTTGNVTASYFFGSGSQLTGLPAPTVTQDIASNGAMSIMLYDGVIKYNNYATVEPSSGNITGGNILTGGLISATGNISGNYFVGNGSQLTGISTNANTGNITFADTTISTNSAAAGIDVFLRGGTATGCGASGGNSIILSGLGGGINQIGSGNVVIKTGNSHTNIWTFDAAGNLNLPGNIIAINYADGNRAFGTVTFSDEAVIGTGTSNTVSGLYLAPDPVSLTNDLYLRVRGNIYDEPTHIHFDTGNNAYYNQYIGDDNKYILLANTGNVVVNTNDSVGNSAQWTFDNFGTLALPGGSRLRPLGANLDIFAGTGSYVNLITSDESSSMGVGGAGGYVVTAGGTWNFNTNGNLTAPGNVSAVGNITGGNIVTSGSGGDITMSAGNITGAGNISAGNVSTTGNVTAANFFGNGNTLSNVATTFESTWTVPTGNSTQSFTVTPNNTYYLWVDCNIPNGILTWNATATITNTNVPVVGAQYAWVYNGGGTPIDFTSIPNQFIGTANTIVRSSVAPSATTNRFDFGINNTSGNTVTVNYGYARIS
jgi:hypothetical protein